jgi:hypothetical protein
LNPEWTVPELEEVWWIIHTHVVFDHAAAFPVRPVWKPTPSAVFAKELCVDGKLAP